MKGLFCAKKKEGKGTTQFWLLKTSRMVPPLRPVHSTTKFSSLASQKQEEDSKNKKGGEPRSPGNDSRRALAAKDLARNAGEPSTSFGESCRISGLEEAEGKKAEKGRSEGVNHQSFFQNLLNRALNRPAKISYCRKILENRLKRTVETGRLQLRPASQ